MRFSQTESELSISAAHTYNKFKSNSSLCSDGFYYISLNDSIKSKIAFPQCHVSSSLSCCTEACIFLISISAVVNSFCFC